MKSELKNYTKRFMAAITPISVLKNNTYLRRLLYEYIPSKKRTGKEQNKIREFLLKAQWWPVEEIKQWQLDKLKEIVSYAYNNVPGYHQLFNEKGANPKDIQTLEDITILPFTTKMLIRDNIKDFISRKFHPKTLIPRMTSGSTGTPFRFYSTPIHHEIEIGFLSHIWSLVNLTLGDRTVVLRGGFIGSENNFFSYRYEDLYQALHLSIFYLNKKTYLKYRNKLTEFAPQFLYVHPSAVNVLADFIIENGDIDKFVGIQAILCSSETLYEWQKEKLKLAFPHTKVFEHYGHTEKAILASTCEHSDYFHVWPFYGLSEILSENDIEVNEGETGEFVGTSFWNYATPFIRYRTTDLAKKGKNRCDMCGRNFLLIRKIEGRIQEIILSKQGHHFLLSPLIGDLQSGLFANIKQFQFYQDTPGKVVFKIVKNIAYSENDTQKIKREMMTKLGEDIAFDIVFVDEISRTKAGKIRILEQELKV